MTIRQLQSEKRAPQVSSHPVPCQQSISLVPCEGSQGMYNIQSTRPLSRDAPPPHLPPCPPSPPEVRLLAGYGSPYTANNPNHWYPANPPRHRYPANNPRQSNQSSPRLRLIKKQTNLSALGVRCRMVCQKKRACFRCSRDCRTPRIALTPTATPQFISERN